MTTEAANSGKTSEKLWNFFDRVKGDKVLWMIVMFLMIISLITIFASASGLADEAKEVTRLNIFFSQFKLACLGMLIIIVIYNFRNLYLIKLGSKLGFLLSLVLLLCLITGFKAITVNGATRALEIGGLQIYVFEVIKVAMVMYLAWAIEAYREDSFKLPKALAVLSPKLAFLEKPVWKRLIYIYLPVIITAAGMFKGGISSTLFTGLLMFVVMFIGGMPKREIFGALLTGVSIIGLFVGIHFATNGKFMPRIGVAIGRITLYQEYRTIEEENRIASIEALRGEKHVWSDDYRHAIDRIRQPESAKLAIKEGGILGKGPGNSTQKYSVYAIYSDYIFSFLIEEFGLIFGGAFVMILYLSVMARGCMIVRFCDTVFAKIAVAGLCLLITGQAFMHILVNVNIGPLTGQTLPLISHGSSSFLCFSVAFGVLLSISRLARRKVDAQIAEVQAEACHESTDNNDVCDNDGYANDGVREYDGYANDDVCDNDGFACGNDDAGDNKRD